MPDDECVVFLNGFPGVGKLAIARELHSQLRRKKTCLFDNHLIIDPAGAIHPGRGTDYKNLRNRLRHMVLNDLEAVSKGTIIHID